MKFRSLAPNLLLTSAFLSSMLLEGAFYIIFHLSTLLFFFLRAPKFHIIHIFTLCTILILIFFTGLSFFSDYQINSIIRDFIYFCKPLISILLGYQLALINNSKNILVTSVFCAVCIYFGFYISEIIMSGLNIISVTVQQWRVATGAGELLVPILIILIHTKFIKLPNSLKRIFLVVLYLQVLITFSRTAYMFLLIYHIVNFYGGHNSYLKFWRLSLVLLFSLTAGAITSIFMLESNDFEFLTKALNSFNELAPNMAFDPQEAGLAWRGFEVALVFEDIATYEYLELLIGKGLGYAVDLPFVMPLAGNLYSDLWFVHNGYLYIFMKLGLAGIGMFIFCIWKLYRSSSINDSHYSIVVTFTLFVVLGTVVMAGPMESNDFGGLLITLGYFYAQHSNGGRTVGR